MGHNPNKIVKTKERKQVLETRSPEDIIKGIRGNLVAHLSITPSDIAFLLVAYDAAIALVAQSTAVLNVATANDALKNEEIANLKVQIVELEEKVAWARQVYEAENRSTTIQVERSLSDEEKAVFTVTTPENLSQLVAPAVGQTVQDIVDLGGEA